MKHILVNAEDADRLIIRVLSDKSWQKMANSLNKFLENHKDFRLALMNFRQKEFYLIDMKNFSIYKFASYQDSNGLYMTFYCVNRLHLHCPYIIKVVLSSGDVKLPR